QANEILGPIIGEGLVEGSNLYAGSRINVVTNRITVYTTELNLRDELLALPQVEPIAHLIDVVEVRLSMNELIHKYRNILALAREHNPVYVGVYIDRERNNVVITLYDDHNIHNAEFIVDVREFNPIYDRQNLHNHQQNLHNEHVGGSVFSYHMNINDGDLRTSRADLKGIITGGVGNFAFITKLEKIRAEAHVDIVTSVDIR
ncbi:10446_t:CDS:2, partial [Racocetra fulgida]